MSGNKKLTAAMILANKKREEIATKTYTVERLLDRRKRKGRIEYLVKWKHWKSNHNSWEPEENILDQTLIDSYEHPVEISRRRSSVISPKKSAPVRQQPKRRRSSVLSNIVNEPEIDDNQIESPSTPEKVDTPVHYWYPPREARKDKIAITDVTAGNVTITFRELI